MRYFIEEWFKIYIYRKMSSKLIAAKFSILQSYRDKNKTHEIERSIWFVFLLFKRLFCCTWIVVYCSVPLFPQFLLSSRYPTLIVESSGKLFLFRDRPLLSRRRIAKVRNAAPQKEEESETSRRGTNMECVETRRWERTQRTTGITRTRTANKIYLTLSTKVKIN